MTIKRRLEALERFAFGHTNVTGFVLEYGGADADLIGYETHSGQQIVRRPGESAEDLYTRAVMTETRLHPEKKNFPLHEIYPAKYWEDKPEWLVNILKIELRGAKNET